jgi:hypothetical protein
MKFSVFNQLTSVKMLLHSSAIFSRPRSTSPMYLINGSLTQGGCDCLSFIIPFSAFTRHNHALIVLDRGGM